ncbi:unnamed protein product [Calypogeia fissa]
MNGTMHYFLMHFVAQARQILESISLVNIEEFSLGAAVIDRIEALYIHHNKRGEKDKKYAQFSAPSRGHDLYTPHVGSSVA